MTGFISNPGALMLQLLYAFARHPKGIPLPRHAKEHIQEGASKVGGASPPSHFPFRAWPAPLTGAFGAGQMGPRVFFIDSLAGQVDRRVFFYRRRPLPPRVSFQDVFWERDV